MHSECRGREDEHLVLLVLDPPEQLIDGSDDLQLGGVRAEGGVQLERLSDPAEDDLLVGGVMAELHLLGGGTDQPALDGEVDGVQPPSVLLQQVAGAVHGGNVLGGGPGLVQEVSHLGDVDTLRSEVDGLQCRGNVCDGSVSLWRLQRSIQNHYY